MTIADERTRHPRTGLTRAEIEDDTLGLRDQRQPTETAWEQWRRATFGSYTPAQRVKVKTVLDVVFGPDEA